MSNGYGAPGASDDSSRSKEMMQKDIDALRNQLESLANCSYTDPFLLGEQLAESISNNSYSASNNNNNMSVRMQTDASRIIPSETPASRGGLVSVGASPPTGQRDKWDADRGRNGGVIRALDNMSEWGGSTPANARDKFGANSRDMITSANEQKLSASALTEQRISALLSSSKLSGQSGANLPGGANRTATGEKYSSSGRVPLPVIAGFVVRVSVYVFIWFVCVCVCLSRVPLPAIAGFVVSVSVYFFFWVCVRMYVDLK